MTAEKKSPDVFAGHCGRGSAGFDQSDMVEEQPEIRGIGDNGVVSQPPLGLKMLQENIQLV